uniref:Uncharacterized protein n=1 Tax=Pelusios castaneus TaxID=367368 RepID=A0A8C8RZX0_9SAUR
MSLALALILLGPVCSQQCLPGNPLFIHQFMEIGTDQQVPAQHRISSSLDPLYSIVRQYLDVVQQNPFPTGEPQSPGLYRSFFVVVAQSCSGWP